MLFTEQDIVMKQPRRNILVERYENHPVYLAVIPFRTLAMDRAEELNREQAMAMYAELEANGWDQNKVAPYPRSGGDYFIQLGRYELCTSITKWVKSVRNPNEPCIVEKDDIRLVKYIEECRYAAALQYDTFTIKLVDKIGECTAATISGNHVWTESFLTVTKNTGTEVWKTKMILNWSKYGKPFHQWPSRKIKNG